MTNATKIIAHRGASRHCRENTLEAFNRAIQCGVDAVEFDVQCTSDDVLIVCHNDYLPSRNKVSIEQTTYPEILTHMFQLGIHIPRLVDVLELCKGRTCCDIELKKSADPSVVLKEAISVLDIDQFQIKSFSSDKIKIVKDLDERVTTALVVGLPSPKKAVRTRIGELFPIKRLEQCRADQIHPHYKLLRLNFLKRMAKTGMPVWIWTVDDSDQLINYLDDPAVDGIITNEPGKALLLRAESESHPILGPLAEE